LRFLVSQQHRVDLLAEDPHEIIQFTHRWPGPDLGMSCRNGLSALWPQKFETGAIAANDWNPPILWKNNVLRAQKVAI